MASNFAKLDKFEGVDFRSWQKKMHFLLSSMSVVYVLTTPIPDDGDDATVDQIRKRAKWDNDDYDSLEAKYMAEDASSMKFLVSNLTNYKMSDSRPVLEQCNELLGILGRFTQHKMNMDEAIQVSCIIDKLPPYWKDFKHTLKHLKEELNLVKLGSNLRIEESLGVQDSDKPKGNNVAGPLIVNMVEHNNYSRYNDNKGKHKHHDNTRVDPNKQAKPTCWKCGKTSHIKRNCKGVNVGNKANGSGTKGSYDDVAWWADSRAITHVYKDRCWFTTYESLNDGSILHMGNESTALVHRRGCVDLRLNIVNDNIGLAFMSSSKLNDSIVWHARLGHVHFKRMQDMSKDGVPNKRNKITAYELWTKRKPNLNYLRVWGYRVVVRIPDPKLKTLGERGIECVFVGYAEHSKAFRFSSVPRPSLRILNGTEDIGGSMVPKEVTEEVVHQPKLELRKSKRNKTLKDFRLEFQLYLIKGTRDEKEAINDEMDSILGNNTWVLADLPLGCKPLGWKWIFKRKLKVDGIIEITIRLRIAMASIYNLVIHQMDVKTAFLNGDLDEEAPKQWHQKFDEVVLSNGYLLNQADKCVYSKFDETVLYEGHGEADVILGIMIKHKSNGIAISQLNYIEKVLKKFNYFDCIIVSTPMDTSEKLMPNNGQAVSQFEYSRVIGCLMYVMTCTRPNIAFIVGKLSRYTSNPGTQHWQAIQRGAHLRIHTPDRVVKPNRSI
ncbi:zinc finger, CCHC-type containing protein [Tanacetum coccineum]